MISFYSNLVLTVFLVIFLLSYTEMI